MYLLYFYSKSVSFKKKGFNLVKCHLYFLTFLYPTPQCCLLFLCQDIQKSCQTCHLWMTTLILYLRTQTFLQELNLQTTIYQVGVYEIKIQFYQCSFFGNLPSLDMFFINATFLFNDQLGGICWRTVVDANIFIQPHRCSSFDNFCDMSPCNSSSTQTLPPQWKAFWWFCLFPVEVNSSPPAPFRAFPSFYTWSIITVCQPFSVVSPNSSHIPVTR